MLLIIIEIMKLFLARSKFVRNDPHEAGNSESKTAVNESIKDSAIFAAPLHDNVFYHCFDRR